MKDEARHVNCFAPAEWVCNHIVGELLNLQPAEALWTGPLLYIRGGRYWSRPSQGSPWFNEEGLPSSLFDVYIAQHQALKASWHPTNKSQAMNFGLLEYYILLYWQAKSDPLTRKLGTVVPIRCGVHLNTFPTIMFVWQDRFPALKQNIKSNIVFSYTRIPDSRMVWTLVDRKKKNIHDQSSSNTDL